MTGESQKNAASRALLSCLTLGNDSDICNDAVVS